MSFNFFLSSDMAQTLPSSFNHNHDDFQKEQQSQTQELMKNQISQDIEKLSNEISLQNEQNTSYRKEIKKLTDDLDTLTTALKKVLEELSTYISTKKHENEEILKEINGQQAELDDIRNTLLILIKQGYDIFSIQNVDIELLLELTNIDYAELGLDPIAQQVIETNPYFQNCTNNKQFIQKAIQLKNELFRKKDKASRAADHIQSLSLELRRLQDKNAQIQGDIGRKMKELVKQRDDLLNEISKKKSQN